MVIDTSVIVAILLREPEAEEFNRRIMETPVRLISAVTRVESSFVIEGRFGEPGRTDLDRLLTDTRMEITAVTAQQVEMAIDAFRRYGKGRHRARLNIGDCFAYALAKATGLPLLFKGTDFGPDFGLTDIPSVLRS
ncbi:MAG TPA: type II toxin-antitoxin system VapC family toxin [Stellaceae bacterium]|jgi:ribonuclease VapC|nr:type II toxin-antitoxin system VapC family toxin [Stellaceae bacterium]